MANMFQGTNMASTTTTFNNGEPNSLQTIPSVTPSTSSYANTSKLLTCPGAKFTSTLVAGDVLVITTSSTLYKSSIFKINSDTTLTLTTALGVNLAVGKIYTIKKSVPGTSPLLWNTSKVTNMSNMFKYCIGFNQILTTTPSYWNTNLVTDVTSIFQGISSISTHTFNNGQSAVGTTAPMEWIFNVVPTSSNYRLNCLLTTSNALA